MIFEALQSELVIFDFYLMRSKLQKIPEFNVNISTSGEFYLIKANVDK